MLTPICFVAALIAIQPEPDPGNGGLSLPDGFAAVVVHEGVGRARHITVRDNGDIYVALNKAGTDGGIVCLRDDDGDGKADVIEYFGQVEGTGIALRDEWLYFGENYRIVRYKLPAESLVPTGEPELVVGGFVQNGQHAAKTIAFGDDGRLYVNCGAPANACQEQMRTPGSQGHQPCPLLEHAGGIWSYDPDQLNQNHPDDGVRFATGLRNCVAMTTHNDSVYIVMHGRDSLNTLFPDFYDTKQNAELPSEEMHRLKQGSNAGWPYTYWDGGRAQRMVGPEYGGDGKTASTNDDYQDPIQAFPAHWAPNGVMIYEGEQFPDRYKGGAFVAFHGSWNRAPEIQAGYKVTFTPFADGLPSEPYSVFADGFAGMEEVRSPREAKHRPMGLATGPDGSVYICDSVKGTIWRVFYVGHDG